MVVRSLAADPQFRYYTTISNSTISGNTAGTNGGGLDNSGATFLIDVTVAENSTGIATNSNFVALQGTLLANTGANCTVLTADTFFSEGHNLSDDASCDAIFTDTGDLRNVSPQIEPLATNAPGSTPTHALALTSPARDAGSCALDLTPADYEPSPGFRGEIVDPGVNFAADQRGVSRPQRLTCDIGAFEPVNNAPVAGDNTYTPQATTLNVATPGVLGHDGDADANPLTVTEDTPLNVAAPGVLANDSDPDGGALTAVLVKLPAHGSLTLNQHSRLRRIFLALARAGETRRMTPSAPSTIPTRKPSGRRANSLRMPGGPVAARSAGGILFASMRAIHPSPRCRIGCARHAGLCHGVAAITRAAPADMRPRRRPSRTSAPRRVSAWSPGCPP